MAFAIESSPQGLPTAAVQKLTFKDRMLADACESIGLYLNYRLLKMAGSDSEECHEGHTASR